MEFLSSLSLAHWLISIVLPAFVVGCGFVLWFNRRFWHLYRNLKRPIRVLTTINSDHEKILGTEMENEIKLLNSNGFLNVVNKGNYESFNPDDEHCIVVIGYHKSMAGLNELMSMIRNKCIPLIVYTFKQNVNCISPEHKKLFDSYANLLYANFPLTLMNHIFSTVACYPYNWNKK